MKSQYWGIVRRSFSNTGLLWSLTRRLALQSWSLTVWSLSPNWQRPCAHRRMTILNDRVGVLPPVSHPLRLNDELQFAGMVTRPAVAVQERGDLPAATGRTVNKSDAPPPVLLVKERLEREVQAHYQPCSHSQPHHWPRLHRTPPSRLTGTWVMRLTLPEKPTQRTVTLAGLTSTGNVSEGNSTVAV